MAPKPPARSGLFGARFNGALMALLVFSGNRDNTNLQSMGGDSPDDTESAVAHAFFWRLSGNARF